MPAASTRVIRNQSWPWHKLSPLATYTLDPEAARTSCVINLTIRSPEWKGSFIDLILKYARPIHWKKSQRKRQPVYILELLLSRVRFDEGIEGWLNYLVINYAVRHREMLKIHNNFTTEEWRLISCGLAFRSPRPAAFADIKLREETSWNENDKLWNSIKRVEFANWFLYVFMLLALTSIRLK